MPDEEVAALMRSDREEVERRRAGLLQHVAHELGLDSPDEAVNALMRGWGVPDDAPPAIAAPPAERERARRRRPLLLAALLAAAVLFAAVLLLRGGGDEPSQPLVPAEPAPSKPQAAPAEPPQSEPGKPLTPVAGADAEASVTRLEDGILRLRLERIPPGNYSVWLYDSVANAAPLVRFRGKPGQVDIRVPADAARYRFIDVSREPADGNANHSGESVLRIPVRQALGRP